MRAIPREVNDAFLKDAADAYAFGLWCADSYWWSSSIGISNVEPELVVRFSTYLVRTLSPERLRVRVYLVPGDQPDERVVRLTDRVSIRPAVKMKRTAYHAYVNSRVLVRCFLGARSHVSELLPDHLIAAYVAGRFDGDGCLGSRVRIAYTTEEEARVDRTVLERVGITATSVLTYSSAREYCVYIKKTAVDEFVRLIAPFSWKAASFHPVETVMASIPGKLPNL